VYIRQIFIEHLTTFLSEWINMPHYYSKRFNWVRSPLEVPAFNPFPLEIDCIAEQLVELQC